MSDQTNRGSSHAFKQMNLALKKSNEKLDVLIELITQLINKEK